MKPTLFCLICCALGVLLVAASYVWQGGVGNRVFRSEADAQALADSAARLHQMTYEHAEAKESMGKLDSSKQRSVSDAELAAISDEYKSRQRELDQARDSVAFGSQLLWGLGALFVAGGGIGYLVVKNLAEDKDN
jgi:hypothetical protein